MPWILRNRPRTRNRPRWQYEPKICRRYRRALKFHIYFIFGVWVYLGKYWVISIIGYGIMMKYVASSWVLPQWGGNFGFMATVSLSWGAERFSQATEKLRPNDSDCGCVDSTSCRFYMQSSLIKVVSAVRVNDSLCNSQKILIRTGNSLCWLGCLRTRLLEPSSFPKRWLRARFGCPRTFDRYQLTFGQLPGWSCQ